MATARTRAVAGFGWIYIEDVTVPGGTATSKVFQDVGNTVLQSVTVSSLSIEVAVRASYPLVTVGGVDATLTRDGGGGFYSGTVAVTLGAAGDVVAVIKDPDDVSGARDTVAVTLAAPPALTALSFSGGYPGSQIELKEDDSFSITLVADKLFDQVEIIDFEAGKAAIIGVAPTLSTTVAITAADRGTSLQALAARVRVRDATTGAFSVTRDTDELGGTTDAVDLVFLNNLFPSGSVTSTVFPVTQGALKGVETATVNHLATDFDTIVYTDPTTTNISVANATTFEPAKIVTCLNPGTFNETVTNFRYVMTRAANAAVTTINHVVLVQDVAPIIDLSLPASRLRSGGNNGTSPQDYVLTLTSDQQLETTVPTLVTDAGGTRGSFTGPFIGGPNVFTRSIRVDETAIDEKGTFAFGSLSATNLAGINTAIINSGAAYTLGGFVSRSLTFAAFATTTSLGTEVVTFAKLQAGIFTSTNQTALKQPISTPPSVTNGFTIDAVGVNPTSLIWLDTPAAAANSGGTAQITAVEETV